MKKSPCGKGYTTCLCFLVECPNYLNQFCIILLAALSCKKEFFLNTEIAPPAPPVLRPLSLIDKFWICNFKLHICCPGIPPYIKDLKIPAITCYLLCALVCLALCVIAKYKTTLWFEAKIARQMFKIFAQGRNSTDYNIGVEETPSYTR